MSTKKCNVCLEIKEISEFYKTQRGNPKSRCKHCDSRKSRRCHEKKPLAIRLHKAKDRAKQRSLAFNLTIEYLEEIWTGYCPVFGTKLNKFAKRGKEGGYQLDRIYPKLGYVIGNIAWLSDRANRLKDNMTVDEAEMIFKFLKSQEKSNET